MMSRSVLYLQRARGFFSFHVALYIDIITRKHSSRMHTASLLIVESGVYIPPDTHTFITHTPPNTMHAGIHPMDRMSDTGLVRY